MAKRRYLEVSSSNGKVIAGYLTFGRQPEDVSIRTTNPGPGLVVDYADGDRPIGLEVTAPSRVTLESINRVLVSLGQPPATAAELELLLPSRGGAAVAASG